MCLSEGGEGGGGREKRGEGEEGGGGGEGGGRGETALWNRAGREEGEGLTDEEPC